MRPTYDPLDTQGLEAAKAEELERRRIVQANEEQDFTWLMSSKRGRRIVWRLLSEAGVFLPTFNTNSMQMAFNEGRRNYGLQTLTTLHRLCPELYPVMQKEATNVNRNDD